MKFEEITVARQSTSPRKPTITKPAITQVTMGRSTQRIFLKITPRVEMRKTRTPIPNTTKSLFTKSTMSAAIMGTPPK